MAENLLDIVYLDTQEFSCNDSCTPCDFKERTRSFALFINIPDQLETPEEVFKECCYSHQVLADTNSTLSYKNDYSSFYHKRQVSNETCEFILIDLSDNSEHNLNDTTYGTLKDFGSLSDSPNLKIFELEWRKVLIAFGQKAFKVVKDVSIASVTYREEYLVYNLNQYADYLADNTIRIDAYMDGYMQKIGVNFKNSSFKTTLRLPGFFGARTPSVEQDNLITSTYEKRQISIKQTNTYTMQTRMVPDCITKSVYDFILLADKLQINDYNLKNHTYDYKLFDVSLETIEEPLYAAFSRKSRITLTFTDKNLNQINRV